MDVNSKKVLCGLSLGMREEPSWFVEWGKNPVAPLSRSCWLSSQVDAFSLLEIGKSSAFSSQSYKLNTKHWVLGGMCRANGKRGLCYIYQQT